MTSIDDIRARAQKAESEMDRLTAGTPGTNWRWSIPANPERDSDLILSASAADVRKLLAALDAVVKYVDECGLYPIHVGEIEAEIQKALKGDAV